MTLFEYLAIAFSLVFSFSAMRILAGIAAATRRDRRYWVHVSFVCVHLAVTVLAFWSFWSFRHADWALPSFALALAGPGLIYFLACALIPEDASSVKCWREYYYSVRRRFFVGLALWALVVSGIVTVLLDTSWLHPIRASHVTALAIGIAGASSESPRVHGALAVAMVVGTLAFASTLLLRPAPLLR